MSLDQQILLEDSYLMHSYGRKPVEFVSGLGMHLFDDEGRKYLDFLAGIGVVCLGHCHPAVVKAIQDQAEKLIHVSNYYYIEQRGELAQELSKLLNDGISPETQRPWKSFFANSGAEANECAIKLARLYARRRACQEGLPAEQSPSLIVTLQGSFHGRTLAALAATSQVSKQKDFEPLPQGFVSTPINDVAALEKLFEERGSEICAMLVECIQGESGVHPCTREFLQKARSLTASHGALLICDEVQCGVFRTGTPFAYQQFGIYPDIVTIAKGIANGIPMGVCAARGPVADTFQPGDQGSTFGGSCIAIAAAHTTLDTLQKVSLGKSVATVGTYFQERLAELPKVVEVRGLGLMVAIDLEEGAPTAPEVVNAALDDGFVLNATGERTLRFLPPLICAKEYVDELIEELESLLKA